MSAENIITTKYNQVIQSPSFVKFRFIFPLHYHISLLVSILSENVLRSVRRQEFCSFVNDVRRQEFPLDNLPKFFYTIFNCEKGKDGKEYARRWGTERRRWVQVSPRRRGRSSRSRLSEPTSTADRIPPLREKKCGRVSPARIQVVPRKMFRPESRTGFGVFFYFSDPKRRRL